MNLRKKLILALTLFTTLFVTSIYILSSSIILKGFGKVEDEINQKTIERFKKVIEDELSTLTITSVGWSSWDESFNFATGKKSSEHYIRDNFEIETIFDSKFTRVTFFDLNLINLFSKEYLHDVKKITDTNTETIKLFHDLVLKPATVKKLVAPRTGIFVYNNKAELFSLNPVFPGSGKGEHVGYIVFFRAIDQERLEKFSRLMNFQIHLNILPKVIDKTEQIQLINNQENTLAKIVIDSFDKKMEIHFDFKIPRSVFIYGSNINNKFLVMLLLITMLLCLVVYRFFDKYIIKKILIINSELHEIATNKFQKSSVTLFEADELGQLSLSINETLETLNNNNIIINRTSKFSALGEIAASLAHEINNPITAISLQAASIAKQLDKPNANVDEIKVKVDKIKSQTQRIEKIIKSLRFISRDGDLDPFELVKLENIYNEINSLFIETLSYKNISLDTSEFDTSLELHCRPVQIVQILINLINNSIDAIENLEVRWIKIMAGKNGSTLYISLTDSGFISDESVAKKMMEPFYTTKPSGKGTGLGLSITKKIMESHGGALKFERSPNTKFILEFPQK